MPSEPGPGRARDGAAAAGVGTLLLTGVVAAAGALFAQRALFAEGAQALAAQVGAGMLGGDGDDVAADARLLRGRVATGAGLALAFAAIFVVVARATRALEPVGVSASFFGIFAAALDAVLVAVRDELLLHGMVLRVARGRGLAVGLLACGLASGAWALGMGGAAGVPLTRLATEILLGGAFGALWARERGPWTPVAAHATWLLATTGGPLALRATPGLWGGGDAGFLGGMCAIVASALAFAAAARWAARRESSTSPRPVG
jgi:hypothetical protein